MKVYVTGATGLIGRHVLEELARRKHEVVALSRHPEKVAAVDGVIARKVDLLDLESILPAIEDCEAGIHCAGVGPGAGIEQQQAANVQASRHLVAAARRKKHLRRLVAITSAAVNEAADTLYRQHKVGQEAALRIAQLDLTLIRPTLVLGRPSESAEMQQNVDRLRAGSVWVPGGGRKRVQPVHVDDLATAAANALERPATIGQTITVAGLDGGIPYRELLELIRTHSGGRARIRSFPILPMQVAAVPLSLIGRSGPVRAQIAYYTHDHVYPQEPARAGLDHVPRSYADAVAACLSA